MPLYPLPTGLAKLHLGISGLATWLQAPFKDGICPFLASPHYCLCPLSPSAFIHPWSSP